METLLVCASSDMNDSRLSLPTPIASPASASDFSTTPTSFPQNPNNSNNTPPHQRQRHIRLIYYRRRGIQARGGSSALFAPTPSEMSGLFDSFLFSPHAQCFCIGRKEMREAKISPGIGQCTRGTGCAV